MHFPEWKYIFILIKISLNVVLKGPINNIPALGQIMAWRHSDSKPSSEPRVVSLLMHKCITQLQYMMTSSNGNIFRITGYLCGEFTGSRQIPRTKGQRRGALMFSLICVWINGWENNLEAGDLRRYHAHYDVTVMRLTRDAKTVLQYFIHQASCPVWHD